MGEPSESSHELHCSSCSFGSKDDKNITSYWFQTDVFRQVFLAEDLLLCAICRKVAEKAEKLIHNVLKNIKYLETMKQPSDLVFETHPIVILDHVNLESISLSGNEESISTVEVYSSRRDIEEVRRDIEEVRREKEECGKVRIKLELEEEALDHLEGEFLDDDAVFRLDNIKEEDEYPLKLLKQELELEGVRIKCFKKEKKRRKIKKKKLVKLEQEGEKESTSEERDEGIEVIHITKEQCYAEREAALQDKLYVNSIYHCTTCIKGFSFKASFDRHMEKHDVSSGKYACNICKQRMDSSARLKNHYRYHTQRYRCTVCGLTRANKPSIQDHYTAKHGEGLHPYTCPHCAKTFMRKVGLRKHIIYLHRRSAKVSCPYCNKNYVNQQSLKAHCIRRHPTEVSATKRLKQNTCQECGMAFASPSQLRYHSVKHSERKDYYCVECDKSFKTDSILKNHLKTASPHVNYTELPLPCEHCEKRFAIRRDLENHMNRIHLKIKPYQCDQCEKAYINSWGLREHQRLIHEGYKRPLRFPCPMCDKIFDRNQILKSHIRTHTGERPYQCSKCPAQFSQASVLGTHVKLIHLKLTRDGRPKGGHIAR